VIDFDPTGFVATRTKDADDSSASNYNKALIAVVPSVAT
jgi:hypothetical protein